MHKFAKILPESECGSRLRMVRWYTKHALKTD